MINSKIVSQLIAQFPEALRDPSALKSAAFKEATKLLQSKISGTIPGLPASLSGVKAEGLKLAKAEIRKRAGRLKFLDELLK